MTNPSFICTVGIELWHLIFIIMIIEGLGAFFNPALQASLFGFSGGDRDALQYTNTLMDSTHRMAKIFGPSLTGVLLLFIPLTDFFVLDSFTFLISAVSLVLVKNDFKDINHTGIREVRKSSPFQELMEAFHLLNLHTILKWALISKAAVSIAWGIAYMVGLSVFTKVVLQEDVQVYGWLGGIYGIGTLISLWAFSNIGKNLSMMYVGHIILGLGFMIFASSDSIMGAAIGILIAAIGSPIGDIMLLNKIQTDFPTMHVGKIFSIRALLGGGGLSLGVLAAGGLFESFSIQTVIFLNGIFVLIIGMTGILLMRKWKGANKIEILSIKQNNI